MGRAWLFANARPQFSLEYAEGIPMRRFALLSLVLFGLAVVSGCGSGDTLNRQPVSGTVKLDGQPLASGSIRFIPQDTTGKVTSGGGPITDGKYSTDLPPGKYLVKIFSTEEKEGGFDPSKPPGTEERGGRDHFPPLSQGDLIQWVELLQELRAIGYAGAMNFEPSGEPVHHGSIEATARFPQRIVAMAAAAAE